MNAPLRATPGNLDAELDRFQVFSKAEIVALLRAVADANTMVTISFNQGSEFIVTTLLEVAPDEDTLIFDLGADAQANARLLRAPRMMVSTVLNDVKLQFSTARATRATFEDGPALRLDLPDMLLRLQRREHYRVRTPISRPLVVDVAHPLAPGTRTGLRILNLSCGGIAMVAASESLALESGMTLADCRIELPGFGTVHTTLEVRNIAGFEERGGKRMQRCGCQFTDLPPATVTLLQRYITKLERENATLR